MLANDGNKSQDCNQDRFIDSSMERASACDFSFFFLVYENQSDLSNNMTVF